MKKGHKLAASVRPKQNGAKDPDAKKKNRQTLTLALAYSESLKVTSLPVNLCLSS